MSRVTSNTKGPQRKISSGSQVFTKNTTPIEALNQAKELTDKFRISMMKFHGDSEKPFSKRYASISDRVTKSTKAVLSGIAKQPIHRTKIPVNLSIFQYDGNNIVKASGHLDTVKGKLVFIDEKSSTPIIFDGVKSLKDKALPH